MKFIKAQEFIQLMQKRRQLAIINVLPKESYEQEHIKGSINIPVSDPHFVSKVKGKFPNKEELIVVHCSSLHCPASTEAAQKLEAAGYLNVLDFKGGIQEWKEAGQELESFSKLHRNF